MDGLAARVAEALIARNLIGESYRDEVVAVVHAQQCSAQSAMEALLDGIEASYAEALDKGDR